MSGHIKFNPGIIFSKPIEPTSCMLAHIQQHYLSIFPSLGNFQTACRTRPLPVFITCTIANASAFTTMATLSRALSSQHDTGQRGFGDPAS